MGPDTQLPAGCSLYSRCLINAHRGLALAVQVPQRVLAEVGLGCQGFAVVKPLRERRQGCQETPRSPMSFWQSLASLVESSRTHCGVLSWAQGARPCDPCGDQLLAGGWPGNGRPRVAGGARAVHQRLTWELSARLDSEPQERPERLISSPARHRAISFVTTEGDTQVTGL